MEFTRKQLEDLFKDEIETDEVLSEVNHKENNFLYVGIDTSKKKGNSTDIDFFIKFDLRTKEFTRINLKTFLEDTFKDYDPILESIEEKKYIDSDDVFGFVKREYQENIELVLREDQETDEGLVVSFEREEYRGKFIEFLKKAKLTYYLMGDYTIAIYRILEGK